MSISLDSSIAEVKRRARRRRLLLALVYDWAYALFFETTLTCTTKLTPTRLPSIVHASALESVTATLSTHNNRRKARIRLIISC